MDADLKDRLQAALGTSYRVQSELGGGGMGRVFVADEVDLDRRVVVKVLPPEMAAVPDDPLLQNLHADPRWPKLLARMGIR